MAQWLASWAPNLWTRVQSPVQPMLRRSFIHCHKCLLPNYRGPCLFIKSYLGKSDVELSDPSIHYPEGLHRAYILTGFFRGFLSTSHAGASSQEGLGTQCVSPHYETEGGIEYLNSLPVCFHHNPLTVFLSSFALAFWNRNFSFQINSRIKVFK